MIDSQPAYPALGQIPQGKKVRRVEGFEWQRCSMEQASGDGINRCSDRKMIDTNTEHLTPGLEVAAPGAFASLGGAVAGPGAAIATRIAKLQPLLADDPPIR